MSVVRLVAWALVAAVVVAAAYFGGTYGVGLILFATIAVAVGALFGLLTGVLATAVAWLTGRRREGSR
jgi:hypothetical protein